MGSKNKNKTKTNPNNSPAAAIDTISPPSKTATHHAGGSGGKIISDPRFSSLHSDPRFRDAPKRKSKVSIDSRFSRMFTDKNFASSKVRIDKRGKTKEEGENKLKRYYSLDDEDIEEKEKIENPEVEEEVNVDNFKEKAKNKNRKLKEEFNVEKIKEKAKDNDRKVEEEFSIEKINEKAKTKNRKVEELNLGKSKEKAKNKKRKVEEKLYVEKIKENGKNKKGKVKEEFNIEKIESDDDNESECSEEEESNDDNESQENIEEESEESEEEEEEEEVKAKQVFNAKRELGSEEEGDEEEEEEEEDEGDRDEDSSSTSSSDEDEEGYVEDEDDILVQEENIPEIDKETHRLAIVNMDWSQVKAVDLYVLLSSFLPKGGQIKSVAVYPSEFGLQRMDEEAVRGPVGLFDDENDDSEDDGDDDDDDDEIDEKKLREYELSRLRYYYAVVECDSAATADYLYMNCDGVEFERSSVKLDLRFIPDSMELKHQPRDVAREAPSSYDGLEFETRALQQSKVDITWDEDEPQRMKVLRQRTFTVDQLAELEHNDEYMASDESGTDDDENDDDIAHKSTKTHKKQDMYRALLQSGEEGSGGSEDDECQDMEVTFNTGLEDISKRILEKKDKESETVWEAYLRKKKEKKKGRKTNAKSSDDEISDSDQEVAEQPDDFFVEEPSIKVKGTGKRATTAKQKSETAEAEASRAELELLLADDNGADSGIKGYNLKPKKTKGKKGKEIPDESKIPTVDYEDPRFSKLFNSSLFALDPTDPQFKRSAAYARQLVQKQRSGDTPDVADDVHAENPRDTLISGKSVDKEEHLQSDSLPTGNQKPEFSLMVKSIKMKAKQHRASKDDVSRLLPAPKRRKQQRV